MEEEIAVRYTFVMLLALADPTGLVVGTDIAIARRLNMPLKQFAKCAKALQATDDNSNSKESEGRRIIPSEAERGYQIVNYAKYRDLQSEDERRAYMRDYMRNYREGKPTVSPGKLSVNNVKPGKQALAKLTQADAAVASEPEAKAGGKANGLAPRLSILDLKDIIAAKQKVADDLKNVHSYEVAMGTEWSNQDKRREYKVIVREIKELTTQLSKMA